MCVCCSSFGKKSPPPSWRLVQENYSKLCISTCSIRGYPSIWSTRDYLTIWTWLFQTNQILISVPQASPSLCTWVTHRTQCTWNSITNPFAMNSPQERWPYSRDMRSSTEPSDLFLQPLIAGTVLSYSSSSNGTVRTKWINIFVVVFRLFKQLSIEQQFRWTSIYTS